MDVTPPSPPSPPPRYIEVVIHQSSDILSQAPALRSHLAVIAKLLMGRNEKQKPRQTSSDLTTNNTVAP